MNPNIAHGLMLARIADEKNASAFFRPAVSTIGGSPHHPHAQGPLGSRQPGLNGNGPMAFLVGVPAAQAMNVPPPGQKDSGGERRRWSIQPADGRWHGGLADRADRGRQCPAGFRAYLAGRPGGPACHRGAALSPLNTTDEPDRWISARPPEPGSKDPGPADVRIEASPAHRSPTAVAGLHGWPGARDAPYSGRRCQPDVGWIELSEYRYIHGVVHVAGVIERLVRLGLLGRHGASFMTSWSTAGPIARCSRVVPLRGGLGD